ncbi:MAG: hypothetical protein QM813_27290 [Verrucomicrobiota bacterium]
MIEVPQRMALMILCVFLGLTVTAGALGYWLATRNEETAPVTMLSDATAPTYAAKPGPWGELQCQRSIIEVPEAFLGTRSWETEPLQWFFRGYSTAELDQFLARIGLSASESKELRDSSKWRVTAEGIFVHPQLETVLSLASGPRGLLYAELAKDEENAMQNQPFHWLLTDAEHLFDGTRVTPEAIAVFRKLSYVRGKYLLFSDWKALLWALSDSKQREVVTQALMGRFVLFASIHITPQTDRDALMRYWGNGGYARDVRPLLEAAARLPEGTDLSIANLLPPHIRAQINTFPFTAPNEQLNCHWTTFNFFNTTPQPPANVRFWQNQLQSDYSPVTDSPRYGDVLLLFKPDNKLIHSCVYLADDIVYTKNGGSPFAPWQLSTIPDLLVFYSWDLPENTALKTAWYRKRS